ncbi:hypothetical protein DdX_02742 [Ditylenchus destructor]|uniref:Uncharacterized protein n=1 Tax=Ditylenchus destructor TaxID=166010 RepID=A0AAD4RC79_9BILA|nr:hypothetical protein DdX_02742 [Ditylenchus destructor]
MSAQPLPVITDEADRKCLHAEFDHFLIAKKKKERQQTLYKYVSLFLTVDVLGVVLLFFLLKDAWAVRFICVIVSIPLCCAYGFIKRKPRFCWPQMVINVFRVLVVDICATCYIFSNAFSYVESHSGYVRQDTAVIILLGIGFIGLAIYSHFIELRTRQLYSMIQEKIGGTPTPDVTSMVKNFIVKRRN